MKVPGQLLIFRFHPVYSVSDDVKSSGPGEQQASGGREDHGQRVAVIRCAQAALDLIGAGLVPRNQLQPKRKTKKEGDVRYQTLLLHV